MEDRTCDWVIGLRQYFESTGDKAFVRELWPALTRLLQWFFDHRTPRGLVLAREAEKPVGNSSATRAIHIFQFMQPPVSVFAMKDKFKLSKND